MISIVIPARNSEKTIGACLSSIKNQDYNDYEVIVVDSSANGKSAQIAQSYGACVIRFSGTPPRARNKGFSESRGDIFLSIDSDMRLEPGLLREISEKIQGAGSLVIPEPGTGRGFISECKSLEKEIYLNDRDVEAVRAFTREIFQKSGGYSEDVHFGEDWDLHERIVRIRKPGRTESGLLHDSSGMTLLGLARKSYRYGKSLPSYLKRNGPGRFMRTRKNFIIGCISKLPSRPAASIGLLAIKGTEYLAGSAGYLEARLKRR